MVGEHTSAPLGHSEVAVHARIVHRQHTELDLGENSVGCSNFEEAPGHVEVTMRASDQHRRCTSVVFDDVRASLLASDKHNVRLSDAGTNAH